MGAGLRKWRGSQISVGQGRGGRDGPAASPGRASSPTLDAAVAPPHPEKKKKTFLSANFPAPATPAGCRAADQAGLGNPVPLPGGGRGGKESRTTADRAAATPSSQPPALCRPWRAARARPASSEVPSTVLGAGRRRPGGMSALPAHLPWRWLQAVRGHRRYPEPHRGPGSTVSWAMLRLATQTPQRDTSGPPSSAYQQSLRLWGGGISRPSLGY